MVRAVYMGSEGFSMPPLRALWHEGPHLATPVEIVGIVTQPDRRSGRGRVFSANAVKKFGLEHNIPVVQPVSLREPGNQASLTALRPDLFIVASFGQILPRTVLELPAMGCLNVHPSLLPRYRGPAPITGALLAGDTVTGICLMQMTSRMDAGPILSARSYRIPTGVTAGELTESLADLAAMILVEDLPAWINGTMEPKPQDETKATYTRLLAKSDGALDWEEPAHVLARRVLAYNPWPGAYSGWNGRQLRLLRADSLAGQEQPGKVIGADADGVLIGSREGILRVTELQLTGGRPLSARDFIAGHRDIVGAVLQTTEL
ncbi:MAG TPA: methionyl-tRNA formyltransferase [Chloroflexota bacterium]